MGNQFSDFGERRTVRFSMEPGVGGLLGAAIGGARNPEYTFYLDGDLCQMSHQKEFLQKRGFRVGQNDVYPCLKAEDEKAALQAIWDSKCDGWWHYLDKYVKHGICTQEQWKKELTDQVEARQLRERIEKELAEQDRKRSTEQPS